MVKDTRNKPVPFFIDLLIYGESLSNGHSQYSLVFRKKPENPSVNMVVLTVGQ